jgi:hypothetical protein
MVNEELDMGSDDEIDLEIDGESASESSSYEQPDSDSKRDATGTNIDRWRSVNMEDRKLKKYNFTKNAGQKLGLPSDAEPRDYFTLFFNEELLSEIVRETNKYAKEKISKLQPSPTSIWNKWTDVCVTEMNAFLGIIINMGLIPLPDIKNWSSEWTTQIKFFGDVMSRDQFLQIFWMLHVGNYVTDTSNGTIKRTKKVHGVIEHTEKQFQKYFVPGINVAIDESTVGFMGKISFKTYNPEKTTNWGLRLFILADSETGYVHSIIPYYGKITEVCNLPYPDKPFTTRIVLPLMDRLGLRVSGIRGYHPFTD